MILLAVWLLSDEGDGYGGLKNAIRLETVPLLVVFPKYGLNSLLLTDEGSDQSSSLLASYYSTNNTNEFTGSANGDFDMEASSEYGDVTYSQANSDTQSDTGNYTTFSPSSPHGSGGSNAAYRMERSSAVAPASGSVRGSFTSNYKKWALSVSSDC
jgi:hypothetical protein